MIVDDPPVMPRIVELFAFLAVGDDGDEGVIGGYFDGSWMPFVGADMARMESLRAFAEEISRKTGKRIVLAKFSAREDVETIGGKGIDA